jgi:tetratricopeptide (TPR) repeat protein
LGRRLRSELGLQADVPASPRWPAASAMREYAEGLRALRRMDPISARDHLQAAVADDPGNALIHSALASAWAALGYGTRANEEDRRAYDMAGSLDRLDRLGIEARYRASLQQWDRAIEIYKTIFQLFPDSLDDGLNLARAQFRGVKTADVSATANTLRKLPAPDGKDPRIDLIEAQTAGTLNDYARTRELAHRAAEEAKARGARYLFARASLLEGGAMRNLNDPKASAVLAEARQACEEIGDRDCVGKALRIHGNERYYAGDFDAAYHAYLQGIAITREVGNRSELANLLVGLGFVAKANRDWKEAERDLIEAISLKTETGFNPNEVRTDLAELYLSLGRLPDAEQVIAAALSTAQTMGAREDLGEIYRLQAALARSRGELDQARRFGENAVTELRQTKNPLTLSQALADLGSVHTAMGDLDAAGKNLIEAAPLDLPESQGPAQLARSQLWIAKGQFQPALQAAEKAAEAFDKAHLDEGSALAFVTAADALEMAHRDQEAMAACREGEKRASLTPNQFPAAVAQLCTWELSTAGGDSIPRLLQARIAKLHNPELGLIADYASALHAERTGSQNYRALYEKLANAAAKLGYLTLSRKAELLGQSGRRQVSK